MRCSLIYEFYNKPFLPAPLSLPIYVFLMIKWVLNRGCGVCLDLSPDLSKFWWTNELHSHFPQSKIFQKTIKLFFFQFKVALGVSPQFFSIWIRVLNHNKYVEIKQFSKEDIEQNNISTVILLIKFLVYQWDPRHLQGSRVVYIFIHTLYSCSI